MYGKSAIAAAIDKRTRITLEQLPPVVSNNNNNKQSTTTAADGDATTTTTDDDGGNNNDGGGGGTLCLQLTNFDYKKEIPLNAIVEKQKEVVPIHRREALILATPEAIDHVQLIHTVNNDVNELNDSLEIMQLTALTAIFYLLRAMFGAAKCSLKYPLKITITSDLNIGAGTGSSASLSVCLVALFYHYIILLKVHNTAVRDNLLHRTFSDQDLLVINKWALNLERIFHGNASGLDNFVATYGSIVHSSMNSENRRVMSLMSAGGMLNILLIYSGIRRSTMHMVQKVSELRERNGTIVDHVFTAMDAVATDAVTVLKQIGSLHIDNPIDINSLNDEIIRLQDLIDINHGLLTSLTVSNKALNEIVDTAAIYNLRAKLTGAGGGGYVYALIPPWTSPENVQHCIKTLDQKGYTSFQVKLGCPGLTLHPN